MSPDLLDRQGQSRRTWIRALQGILLACVLLGTLGSSISCGGGGGGDGTPDPTPTPGSVVGKVKNFVSDQGIAGATVTDGTISTTTGSDGTYAMDVAPGDRKRITVTAQGFGNTQKITSVVSEGTTQLDVTLLPATETTLPGLGSGATLTVDNSPAQIVLPANALVTSTGASPRYPVTASLTPIDPSTLPDLMPGDFTVPGGALLESYGAMDAYFTDSNGALLNLASGKPATIRIPLASRYFETSPRYDNGVPVDSPVGPAAPETVPAFFYDTDAGRWTQEGTLTLAGSGLSQYYEGLVNHFSTWNADKVSQTTCITGKIVRANGTTAVGDATVTATGTSYVGASSINSHTTAGTFTLPVMSNATLTVKATKDFLSSNTPDLSVITGVINGTFEDNTSWTWGTGWALDPTNKVAKHSSAGSIANLTQALPPNLVFAGNYIVTYTLSGTSGTGGMKVSLGGGAASTVRSTAGTYSETLTFGATNKNLVFTSDKAFVGSIDNVTITLPAGTCINVGNIILDGKLRLEGTIRDFSPSTPYVNATTTPPVVVKDSGDPYNYNNPAIKYPFDPAKPWINPDFECRYGSWWQGLVKDTLGPDNKPQYNSPAFTSSLIHSATTFNAWFNDFPSPHGPLDTVPYQKQYAIDLAETDPVGNPGVYTYLNDTQFPIDNWGQGNFIYNNPGDGNTPGTGGNIGTSSGHNFHYTYEIHTSFRYLANQVFTFKGDDDVWVFFNKKLAIDIGGVHQSIEGSLNLTTGVVTYRDWNNNVVATKTIDLGLVAGQVYQFDFFYCERHTTESHMRITTTIPLSTSTIPN